VSDVRQESPRRAAPAWRDYRSLTAGQLPHEVRAWLLDRESLTTRLLRESRGQFRVRRLRQGLGIPPVLESRFLGIPRRQRVLVREVVLLCFGEPWVYARSLVPVSSLKGPLRRLRALGNESLGAIVFSEPSLQRGSFEVCRLPGGSSYIHPDYRQRGEAWARRSHLSVHGHPLLVSEVFLESFRPWAGIRSRRPSGETDRSPDRTGRTPDPRCD